MWVARNSCAFQLFFLKAEAQRMHQMQGGPDGGTGSGNIARILGYFRLKEHYVQIHDTNLPFGRNQHKVPHLRKDGESTL